VTVPLLRRESIGDSYHVLTFDDPDGVFASPGQFAMVRGAEWGDAPLLPRPMSYLTGGSTPSILIKVFGEGTVRMARAEPGEPFSLLGPLGNSWRAPTPGRRQVLVAGGVGIAPLLFFARALANSGQRAITIYGGRSSRDLPLDDDLADVSDVHITTEDGSRGTRGRVTEALEALLAGDMEVYTCGPDRMMARVAELCAARDVPCEASLETPMACGYGVCLGCPVPTTDGQYLYACVQGPCIDARRVDWSRADHAPRKAFSAERKPLP
jgi:dihydroorotate dehydrogenase electron transfer subunit